MTYLSLSPLDHDELNREAKQLNYFKGKKI